MKNIHLLPTDKPSRLYKDGEKLKLDIDSYGVNNQNIYITSDEEIKEGDWVLGGLGGIDIKKYGRYFAEDWKKIILTTDQDLIADGVQAIDNEFLEWFVKNPSRESVVVEKKSYIEIKEISYEGDFQNVEYVNYKIIIPQEEAKQETLEAAENYADKQSDISMRQNPLEYSKSGEELWYESKVDFIEGAKWQQERMYSEEDLEKAFKHGILFKEESVSTCEEAIETEFSMLVEQFKKN